MPTPSSPGASPDPSARPWPERDHAALARRLGAPRAAREPEIMARLAELVGVVNRLRDPGGCPWDREQTVDSMAKNLVEEACETMAAIARDGDAEIAEELGDVLMNVVLIARIAADEERFDLADVAAGIATKLVRRHPHVFGEVSAEDAGEALASWNASKRREGKDARASVLDGVPDELPALLAALRVGEKAAQTGFEWPGHDAALAKVEEELAELAAEVSAAERSGETGDERTAARHARLEEELGDLLFAAVTVGRRLGVDPELALRRTVETFRRRFCQVEQSLGDRLGRAGVDEMIALWRQADRREEGPAAP